MMPRFILASNSPRRRELLSMLGMEFEVIVSDCDETVCKSSTPDELVRELALRKASAVADKLASDGDFIVIGADTVVSHGGRILGKPHDKNDARDTFLSLSEDENSVFTGIALVGRIGGRVRTVTDSTETLVVFGKISEREAQFYADTGEPLDKAGSYAVQGLGGFFVKELHGDYYNVVGLPIARLRELIEREFGIEACEYIGKK